MFHQATYALKRVYINRLEKAIFITISQTKPKNPSSVDLSIKPKTALPGGHCF
jgi:hypothetical protein